MGQIVSIQSYRGGAGKSNFAANLAVALADRGRRTAVLDADLSSPGVHVIFGFDERRLTFGLNDFLAGKCSLEETAYDVSAASGLTAGSLFLVPSRLRTEDVLRLVSEGYDVSVLQRRLASFTTELGLDHLVLDTHPGLNRETLLTTAVSDALLLLIRPDRQDFHGTAVISEIARRLKTPRAWLVANKIPPRSDADAFALRLKTLFDREVLAVLPLAEELMLLGSSGLFLRTRPDHAYCTAVRAVAARLIEVAEVRATSA